MAKKKEDDFIMLQPTGDRILVKRDKGEEKSEAGIIFVKESRKNTGVVLAVGDDEKFTEGKSLIKPGSRIYFLDEGYVPIGPFLLMQTNSVLGVFAADATEKKK